VKKLIRLSILALIYVVTGKAFAICDSELDSYVQLQTEACNFWASRVPVSDRGAYKCDGYRNNKNEYIQGMQKSEMTDETKRSNVSYYQGRLVDTENSTIEQFGSRCLKEFDMECRARGRTAKIAEVRLDLCVARALLDKSVSGGNQGGQRTQQNFTQGQQAQQSQQSQQVQQSACHQELEEAITVSINVGEYKGESRERIRARALGAEPGNVQYRRGLNAAGYAAQESEYLEIIRGRADTPSMVGWTKFNLCMLRNAKSVTPSGTQEGAGPQRLQNQKYGQQSQQAQQLAQQNQTRADQQRQGKRKTNDPAAQAHECIEIDKAGSGNFGAFKNTCNFKVNFSTCNYKPRTIQGGFNWSADFDCEKSQFGLHTPDGGRSVAAHNRNTEMVYWYACKAPATPVDAAFVVGKGIEARCHN
jgi:hypothetical protein